MIPIQYTLILAIIFYISGGFLQFKSFFNQDLKRNNQKLVFFFTLAGVFSHCIYFYNAFSYLSLASFKDNFFFSFSIVAAAITLIITSSSIIQPVENLLIIVLPITCLIIIADLVLGNNTNSIDIAYESDGLITHIFLSLAAYAMISIAAIQAIFIIFQKTTLKHYQQLTLVKELPSLELMEQLLFNFLSFGLLFLTTVIITSIIYYQEIVFHPPLVAKTLLSIGAWLLLSILYIGRKFLNWGGIVITQLTLCGSIFLFLAYLSYKFAIEFLL